jgi:apolipoprotein D and lipocalin family protein
LLADYTGDFALVQSNNFTTLFVLSREQHPEEEVLDVS